MPAPIQGGGAYVAAAYVVFLTLVVVYVAILAAKVARMERELERISELVEESER